MILRAPALPEQEQRQEPKNLTLYPRPLLIAKDV